VMDDEFDEADGLDWGDEEDDEDDDDFDDGDMPDAEGLAEALTGAAGADTTKRARRQEEWIDQRSGAGHKRPAPRAGRPAQSARRQPAHHRR
jgi:hypothetical protein